MAEIIWSDPALDDLDAIAAHIALDKPTAAAAFVAKVIGRVNRLASFPLAGGKPRELVGTRYRQLVVPPVRIFYRVDGATIFIVHVLRGEKQFRRADLDR